VFDPRDSLYPHDHRDMCKLTNEIYERWPRASHPYGPVGPKPTFGHDRSDLTGRYSQHDQTYHARWCSGVVVNFSLGERLPSVPLPSPLPFAFPSPPSFSAPLPSLLHPSSLPLEVGPLNPAKAFGGAP